MSCSVVAKTISGVPDKMSGRPSALCRTFWAPVGQFSQLITVVILVFLVRHSMCIEPCWTKCPARSSSLPEISKSLPDMSGMSGIFRQSHLGSHLIHSAFYAAKHNTGSQGQNDCQNFDIPTTLSWESVDNISNTFNDRSLLRAITNEQSSADSWSGIWVHL